MEAECIDGVVWVIFGVLSQVVQKRKHGLRHNIVAKQYKTKSINKIRQLYNKSYTTLNLCWAGEPGSDFSPRQSWKRFKQNSQHAKYIVQKLSPLSSMT